MDEKDIEYLKKVVAEYEGGVIKELPLVSLSRDELYYFAKGYLQSEAKIAELDAELGRAKYLLLDVEMYGTLYPADGQKPFKEMEIAAENVLKMLAPVPGEAMTEGA